MTGDAGAPAWLAPDPALPGRDDHLHTPWVAARLRTLTGRDVVPLARVRAKYRIGESLRAVHRVVVDGRVATATVRLFVGGAGEHAARRSPAALHDREHDAVWWWFPDDRRLRGVEAVVGADPYLGEQLGLATWAASSVAEYAPERSLTVRAADQHDRALAFVKLYAPVTVALDAIAARYERAARTFAGDPRVAVPRVIGRADDLVALTAMPGHSWTQVARADRTEIMAALGGAIARYHTTPHQQAADRFGRLEVGRVVHSAELVAVARPDVADDLLHAAERLAASRPDDADLVMLHGDCHPKNTLVDGGRIALIDLDQGAVGPAACDIASLLARLRHGLVLGETSAADTEAMGAAFLGGYAEVRPLPSAESLRWHLAAALVAERAVRAVNRVHAGSLARLAELATLTRSVVDAASTAPTPGVTP